ncbi:lipoxygenase 2.3, chloroplastic [Lolium perenne]|uniref:lipoxygenase 2.3, chloroplastic n=1 Tax=Lolium perenne TaxID=4522 RepID=UPI0021F623D6|nr:lipoxygenase 2.3, chloroplastic-like [Lolium perenne]
MTAPLLAALSPSHCPSLLTSTISASRHGAVAPRRGRRACSWRTARSRGGTVSRISCSSTLDDTVKLKATVKIEHTADPSNVKVLHLELVSSNLDSLTGKEKTSIPGDAYYWVTDPIRGHELLLEAIFDVPVSFGPIGAVLVENEVDEKMFLINIVVAPDNNESALSVTFEGNSWIKPKSGDTVKHVFFPLKSYLPSETPPGVQSLRESELKATRGDGTGERNKWDRIYDYEVYNDLGKPDIDDKLTRTVLGGDEHPYPRRCRTGRPCSDKDSSSEKAGNYVYVPMDEVFSPSDDLEFKRLMSSTPGLWTMFDTPERKSLSFPSFTAIDSLFVEQPPSTLSAMLEEMARKLHNASRPASDRMEEALQALKGLKFEMPKLIASDRFAWFRDEEFARQTLSGLNPLSIQLVTEFPFVSKLDEKEYGPRESGLTKELIEEQIGQAMTVEEAVKKKKLFMLDYHDMLLPFVNDVRGLDGTTLYGSRTLFFLTEQGTLRPIAIELTRPKGKPPILAEPWSQVFTPQQWDGTGSWLWKLAKAHVLAHDSGYHQLVSHWLRTHCCVEPYIIAANRQLSRMHPIFRLLHPHFRYTMQINAISRETLINADGIIERAFSPGRYSMMLSSAAYKEHWRFDMEALPADLIRRGMAVEEEDGTLTLTIKDYPYANDGLLVWESIKEWTSDYVKHYYSSAADITGDKELNGWWEEVRTKGHADKKDEPWWPKLDSRESLIQVLTSIMWVTSGHHAAVNFAQYPLAGYFPNRPTIARKKMPVEEGPDRAEHMADFRAKPEKELLEVFPSQFQAVLVMTVLHVLSSHWPDEQHMGRHVEPAWEADPIIKSAFQKLQDKMLENEGIIDDRNEAEDLKNRCGAGVMPYELFKRSSGAGDTGKGLPYSISI